MTPLEPGDPERRIALAYTRAGDRAALAGLFALDEKLAGIVARTSEPAIGLIRLVWWRDALAALAVAPAPAEPVLVALAAFVGEGLDASALAAMTDGWEALLDDPDLGDEAVATHARARGAGLFMLAGRLLSATEADLTRLGLAGEGWARADLARHTADPARAAAILQSAAAPLHLAMVERWPRRLRPIAQLAVLAREDARRGFDRRRAPASPMRLLRILRLQTTGR